MKAFRRAPSTSMVVAITALVVALSGTAVAASNLVTGDQLIKKNSLSGNRLRNHTISGKQVNLNQLGKVPSAKNADHASLAQSAANAVNAQTAQNATNARNAGTLGGQAPSAFDAAANITRSGLITAASGQTVPVASFGPFTLSLRCTSGGGSTFTADLLASSSDANAEGYGFALTGTPTSIANTGTATATFTDNDDNAADFLTATGKSYAGDLAVGVNLPGAANPCFANVLVGKS